MKKMTEKSLNEAFAGESMASTKYLAFSDVAKREGFPNVARLFKAISYAEQVHAANHARNLGSINKTSENLQAAIDGENFEVEEMYAAYDAIATLQGEKGAERSILYAREAEKIHAEMYSDAKAKVDAGSDLKIGTIYICPVCGFTHIGDPPAECPVCNVSSEKFVTFA